MVAPVAIPTIAFTEFGLGTVDPVYDFPNILAEGNFRVTFDGEIVSDPASPTSPAIAANTSYMGPVTFRFSAAVSRVEFDAGVFNAVGSTRVIIEGRNGFRVEHTLNKTTASVYEHFVFDYGENVITRVRLVPVGDEPAGFALDNVQAQVRPESRAATLSGSLAIDNLLHGTKWNGTDITYSFFGAGSKLPGYGTTIETFAGSNNLASTAAALSAGQKAAAATVFGIWDNVAALSFSETADASSPGMMRLFTANITANAQAFLPGHDAEAGDIQIKTGELGGTLRPGTYGYYVLLHEVGHALGLKHPHDGGLGPVMPAGRDSIEYSVMSYRSYVNQPVTGALENSANSYPQSLMMNDIAAIQYLYGPNFGHNAGDTVYSFDPLKVRIFETVWDGSGNDTYDLSAYGTDLIVDLNPGRASTFATSQLAVLKPGAAGSPAIRASGNVYNALLYQGNIASLIENAVGGSGDDRLTGNATGNRLTGGQGKDILDGLAGFDHLVGGFGDDRLLGGTGVDRLTGGPGHDVLNGGDGTDFFIFNAPGESAVGVLRDDIESFVDGEDLIRLAAMDADTTVAGNQAFSFISVAAFTAPGQVRFFQSATATIVLGNVDADLAADFQIEILGHVPFTAADFIL